MKTCLVIDGNNLAFVANSATRLSRKSDDFPTQAIMGFFKALRHYVEKFTPTKIFIAWDGGRCQERMRICPKYKATRYKDPTPEKLLSIEEFRMQLPHIMEMAKLLGCHQMLGKGIEGDDLIAMMAQAIARQGGKAIIVSSDADFLQLVAPSIEFYTTMDHKSRHVTVGNMESIKGLRPGQWLEFKCIVGDNSDNIGGVPGAGEKTAIDVLQKYGTLENFNKAVVAGVIPKLPARWRYIVENPEIIERNRKMMDLARPVGDFRTVRFIQPEPDNNALKAKFIEFELRSIQFDFNNWLSNFNDLESRRAA